MPDSMAYAQCFDTVGRKDIRLIKNTKIFKKQKTKQSRPLIYKGSFFRISGRRKDRHPFNDPFSRRILIIIIITPTTSNTP